MIPSKYVAKLEKKLINDFKKTFHEKIGYIPIVFTKLERDASDIPYMSLEELDLLFTKFLPEKYGAILRLQTKDRMREIVELRSIFCFMAKNMKYSLKNIGIYLGKRDHSTVLHGLKIFRNLLETDEGFRQKFLTIQKFIIEQTNLAVYESFPMDRMLEIQSSTQPAIFSRLLPASYISG